MAVELAAIRGALWVVSKALSPLSDGLVEAWAASSSLAPNIEAVKTQLLYAQAILSNGARGSRDIDNPALAELLQKLRRLAYDADDVLDELDYFRIQDELDGTFETVDRGCFHDLARNARHTTKAATKKLACCTSSKQQQQQHGACCCVGKRISSLPPVHDDDACTCICITPWKKQNRPNKTPKLDFDRVDISTKMRHIVEQLKSLCGNVSTVLDLELLGTVILKLELLGSVRGNGNDIASRSITTTSESLEPELFGREPDKKTITDYITKDVHTNQNLSVLPIVGAGGIGKTTLTQYIYEEVQHLFQIRVWICVSLDFNVYMLTKEIFNSIPKSEDETDGTGEGQQHNLDRLQKLIEKRLKNKRFLLILDDIWKNNIDDEEWKKLLIPFTKGQVKGNIILVTTRFDDVAEMVKNVNVVTQLKALNPTDFWKFFMACVFGHDKTKQPSENSDLFRIGKQIVEKLKGNPLAAKTVGKLLRNNPTPDYWTRVLESKEWDSQTSDYDIMPALKLSYDYLPFHLQQCFSYCALYPEDYKFSSEELIYFWIGQDILCLGYNSSKTIEDIGLENLNELINYGFFKKEIDKSNTYYVMHDLLHDLALNVSSQECLHTDSSRPTFVQIPPSIYHLSIKFNPTNSEDGANEGRFIKELSKIGKRLKYESLRTLMIFGEYDESFIVTLSDLFKDAQSLRVVRLPIISHQKIDSIFHNFSRLLHLRYLKLKSYPWSEHFTGSLSRLYHLRVLDIKECHYGIDLPKDMANLSKLRHFLVPKDSFHSDISNVGKLRCLQELREFKAKKEKVGFKLKELGELEELGGSLSICNLEDVQVNEGHEAKLRYKKHLKKLALNWKGNRSDKNPGIENQILESLQPHSNLCELKISRHGGSTCPPWLSTNLSVKGLEALCLKYVDWKMLPPLGEVWLVDESNVEYFGCITGQIFRNLKRLELIGQQNFRKWIAKQVCPMFFSLLEVLIVKECNELIELPFSYHAHPQLENDETMSTWFPRLRKIIIEECPKLVSLPPIPYTHTLHSVFIRDVGKSLEELEYHGNTSSSNLIIKGNMDANGLDEKVLAFHNLKQLQELGISNSHASGKELTQVLYHLPKLCDLHLSNCDKITQLCIATEQQQSMDQEDDNGLLLFPAHLSNSLSILRIENCQKLILAVVTEHEEETRRHGLQALRSLRSIHIKDCSKFLSAYKSSTSFGFPPFLEDIYIVEDAYYFRSGTDGHTELYIRGVDWTWEGLWPLLTQDQLDLTIDAESNFFCRLGRLQEEQLLLLKRSFKLRQLHTRDISGFLVKPICSLLPSSLTILIFGENYEVERFTEEQEEALQLLTSLQDLQFVICEKLKCLPMGLHRLTNLKKLKIWYCPSIRSLPKGGLPSSLEELDVTDCKKLQCLPTELHTLTNLKKLEIDNCPSIRSGLLKDGQLPSSLEELEVTNWKKLQCLLPAELHRLTNLKKLKIEDCPFIWSLSKGSLPSSLEKLEVTDCKRLRCLPAKLHRLTNLKKLKIWSCSSIRSLPKGGLPSSLEELDVRYCHNEKLKEQCRQLRGTIPNVILEED